MKDNNLIVSDNTIFKNNDSVKISKKYRVKKNISNFFKTTFLLVAASLPTVGFMSYGKNKSLKYEQNNFIFENNKVNADIDYFGGDSRYVSNIYNFFYFGQNNLYNHFNLGENRPIKVGFSEKITNEQKEQFDYCFNYLNQIFEIINPKYSFELKDCNQEKECDIFVDFQNIEQRNGLNIGAHVNWKKNYFTNSCISSAKITFNSSLKLSNTQLRFYMLHEMMHILLGSSDINEKESETFSIYNYGDVAFIISQIENAYSSKAEIPTNGLIIHRPILTKEEKNSYVFLTPVDLATLIALYGDSSKAENKIKYIELLNKTESELTTLFGNQPFYNPKDMPQFKSESNEFEQ